MGKKKIRAKYTSKGGLGGRLLNGRSKRHPLDTAADKWKAFKKGKKVYVTIPNPDPMKTKERWIRVEMSSQFGDFRRY